MSELLFEARHFGVATTITQAAEEQEVDLIVIAPHGSTNLGQSVLGCIAERLVSRCSLPVLLVKRSRQESHAAAAQHTGFGPDTDSAVVHESGDRKFSSVSHILTPSEAQD